MTHTNTHTTDLCCKARCDALRLWALAVVPVREHAVHLAAGLVQISKFLENEIAAKFALVGSGNEIPGQRVESIDGRVPGVTEHLHTFHLAGLDLTPVKLQTAKVLIKFQLMVSCC